MNVSGFEVLLGFFQVLIVGTLVCLLMDTETEATSALEVLLHFIVVKDTSF